MSFPEPHRERWQPLRSGLTDVYKYEEQEFVFEDGRLLLRGNNGTGKSRVLALQLPFLLDGEVSPHRLEPDGDVAKRIEWNLLLDKIERRTGYTWIEFGRRDADGTVHYVTLGCGLSAVRGRSGVTRWFFLTPKRVGESLFLHENRVPLGKERLRAALGGDGELHETVEGWRGAVDRALFRLGPMRYRALMDLLIQLRQPQLSRDLDDKRLSKALTSALPPLSPNVVEPLAGAFRELEADRAELAGFMSAATAANDFLGRYRIYAGVASRRRAARVRTAQAAHMAASGALLRATEAAAAAVAALEAEAQAHEQAVGAEADAQTRLRALEQAPAMDLAREIDTVRTQVEAATDAATSAKSVASAAKIREAERRGRAAKADQAKKDAGAAAARLGVVATAAFAAVGMTAERDRSAWDQAFEARKRAASQLETKERDLAHAVDAHAKALREQVRQQSALDHAREAEALAARSFKEAVGALIAAVAAWSPALFTLDTAAVLTALEVWLEDPRDRSPLEHAVLDAERLAIGVVEAGKAATRLERVAAISERKQAQTEIDRLTLGGHAPPAPWPARAREAGMQGAPLWALVDFKLGSTELAQRGVEAALEGAGLLDAWVTPTGAVLPHGALDAALTLEAPAQDPSLADVLCPVSHPAVPVEVVVALLQRIGLGAGPVWVDDHGNYGLGPVRGAWSKSAAEHIGETARTIQRARLIAELTVRVAALDGIVVRLDQALTELDLHAKRIAAEASARPKDAPVKQAALVSAQCRTVCVQAQALLVEAETVQLARRAAEVAKRTERDVLAEGLGFSAWLGNSRGLEQALAHAGLAAVEHFGAERRLSDAEATLAVATSALGEAQTDLARATEHEAETGAAQREASVRCRALEGAHGAEAASILAQVGQARSDAAERTKHRKTTEAQQLRAVAGQASSESTRLAAAERAAAAEHERDGHLGSVVALLDAGLLGVLDISVPDGLGSPTRVVDLARRLETLLEQVPMDDGAWSRVQDALHRDLEELRRSLLDHRWDPVLRTLDDLAVVEVSLGDSPLRVPALKGQLEDEVRSRAAMLTAREREVIENHLVGELANELHDLIHHGEKLVREMSREVESRAMSTGMRLRFDWRLRDDAGDSLAEARRRLMRQGASWSQADRDLIARFLKDRLDIVRAEDPGATWQQQIERAFDYREWHGFIVERHQDGQWKQLTRRTHGTGSGGEKAIALTIPQLAAAAAYYRNAHTHAPRLILLDEAFVGGDSDMRGKCMGLFASFDLDFVMTSEREWGCYASLPGVAICQLATLPGIEAIDVVRWVWNGHERTQP